MWPLLQTALIITAFVAVMMVVVEYVNVQTQGTVLRLLEAGRLRQYVLAALLGATPGCLGAFVIVALYSHRRVTLGAVVAAMIATSGDEMFVMLTLIPGTAALMTVGLAVGGVLAGWLTDLIWRRGTDTPCCELDLHPLESCRCFPPETLVSQWRPPSPHRAILTVGLVVLILAMALGGLGPAAWGWKRITLLAVMGFGLFVVATVPDHFLDDHLWHHVAMRHVPRIFLWTLGVLLTLALLDHWIDLRAVVGQSPWIILGIAALVGIIPESGPHLFFLTLYVDGVVPLGVLVASSIVQDGHGMLPLLAHSRADFVRVKLVNLAVGLAAGAVLLLLGH